MAAMVEEIIGREDELSVVHAFLDRPVERPRALVLEGEGGIGKSTLWLAGVAAARERALQVLVSRPAETERTLANVVLGDLLSDTEPELLAALPAPRRRALDAALLRDEPDLPVDPRALGAAILTLLPLLVDSRPLVLAIDDDQWMDASSAATLGFALRRLPRLPVLLLLSRRINSAPMTGLEAAVGAAEVERVRIGSLSLGAIQLLLRQRLGVAFSRPMLTRLHEASGGNPFYAVELARAQTVDPGRDPHQPLAMPPSLERLVGARLSALDAQTRRTLLLIAAQGRLPVAFLRAMEVAPEALDLARAAHVIEASDGVIRFTHPLLASAVYQGASDEERRSAHRRLATVVADPVHRGRHHALGADEPDKDLSAALESAASVARDRGLPIAAAELAQHALRLTPPDAIADRHRRAVANARAHSAAGEGSRARAIAADLVAWAPAGRLRAEALVLHSDLEAPDIALTLLRDALPQAAGVPELQAAIHAGLAEAGRFSFAKSRAWEERHASASLRLAERLDDDALRANALSILAVLRFIGRDPRALELAERAYRLAAPLGDQRLLQRAGWSVGHLLTWSGETDPAREWLERQLGDWSDSDERARSSILWYLALVELWSGRWTIASEYADQAREINVQYGMELPQDHFPSALIALHRGQFAVARELSRRGLSLAKGQLPESYFGILAVCDLWSGDPAAALANFIRAEQAADARGSDEPSMREWRGDYVEALLQLGRVGEAARLTADWETAAKPLRRERVLAQAARFRGLIAAARGELSTAINLLEEAAHRHEAVGDPFGRARALLALGVMRRRGRQKRSARAAMEAALVGFEALGAASWAATARAELARIGGRQRMEGLSPSELRVASLVAEGRTNREVAAALFLGERTVGGHLTRIYAKLGIRSRTELARSLPQPQPISRGGASKVETS
jgi:DNA-binding CsgD family transcriptional regulator/tetratricopeptide (TPR) repeat protein